MWKFHKNSYWKTENRHQYYDPHQKSIIMGNIPRPTMHCRLFWQTNVICPELVNCKWLASIFDDTSFACLMFNTNSDFPLVYLASLFLKELTNSKTIAGKFHTVSICKINLKRFNLKISFSKKFCVSLT